MTAVWLVVATLCAWRLTSLVTGERGPFALMTRLRALLGVYHTPDGAPAFDADGEVLLNPITRSDRVDSILHEVARGATCVWCASVWVSMVVALVLARVSPVVYDAASYVLVVGALSAGVILVQAAVDRLRG